MGRKINFLLILDLLFILHSVPVIGIYVPAVLWAVLVILLFMLLLLRRNISLLVSYIPVFLLPILFFIVNVFATDNVIDILIQISELLQLLILPLMSMDIIENNNRRDGKILLVTFLGCMAITSVTTFIGLLKFPGAIRSLTSGDAIRQGMDIIYYRLNIGGFDFIYGLVFCAILFVYLIHQSKYFSNRRFLYVISIVGLLWIAIVLIEAEFMISLLMFSVVVSMLLFQNLLTVRRLAVSTALCFVVFFLLRFSFANLFEFLASSTNSDVLSDRFGNIGTGFKGEQLDAKSDGAARLLRMEIPLKAFIRNPLGSWTFDSHSTGGHSFWLDSLGAFGIVGLILIIWMWRRIYKLSISWRTERTQPWALLFLVIFILTALLNPKPFYDYLFFMMPLFFYIINPNDDEYYYVDDLPQLTD